MATLSYPTDLRYTREHEWARAKGNVATVGITAYAQDHLGDVVYLELPEVGSEVARGKPFGVVESTKAVSELFAPVSGKVLEANQPLVDSPEVINEDPYAEGWMIQVEMKDPKELDELMTAAQYEAFVKEESEG